MRTKPQVTIIGCGVIGLSCGITSLERGWETEIIARDLPPHTDSNKAGAVWFPFKAAPQDLVGKWSAVAHRVFSDLALPASGVHLTTLFDLHSQPVPENPWWVSSLPPNCFRRARPEELPSGYVDGFALRVPIICGRSQAVTAPSSPFTRAPSVSRRPLLRIPRTSHLALTLPGLPSRIKFWGTTGERFLGVC